MNATIRFTCPSCDQHIEGEAGWAGQLTECPRCHQVIEVPMRSSLPDPNQPPRLPAAPARAGGRTRWGLWIGLGMLALALVVVPIGVMIWLVLRSDGFQESFETGRRKAQEVQQAPGRQAPAGRVEVVDWQVERVGEGARGVVLEWRWRGRNGTGKVVRGQWWLTGYDGRGATVWVHRHAVVSGLLPGEEIKRSERVTVPRALYARIQQWEMRWR